MEIGLPQIYMTADEFELAQKSFRRNTVCLAKEEFVGASWRLLLGHRHTSASASHSRLLGSLILFTFIII